MRTAPSLLARMVCTTGEIVVGRAEMVPWCADMVLRRAEMVLGAPKLR